jgi:hypothetical protein
LNQVRLTKLYLNVKQNTALIRNLATMVQRGCAAMMCVLLWFTRGVRRFWEGAEKLFEMQDMGNASEI